MNEQMPVRTAHVLLHGADRHIELAGNIYLSDTLEVIEREDRLRFCGKVM